jgi:mannose-1-phosphate guanylyltransferase/mannose-6-phosphate isomerase
MTAPCVIPMILAGGAGTRLWPLSREAAPKPFMPLPDGETLLGKTAGRALALPGVDTLITLTNRDYYFHTKDTYAALETPASAAAVYLLEPFGRNTAPAVAVGALYAQARGLGSACSSSCRRTI